VFSAGFNHKTAKEDLLVEENHIILQDKQRGKTLEDSMRLSSEAEPEPLTCGAGWSHMQADRSLDPQSASGLLRRFSTALRIVCPLFIQVDLI
jgi:hypothetical protein